MKYDASMLQEKDGYVVLPDGTELNMSREEYEAICRVHEYTLEILLVIDRFCRDNGITYYLGEGTLLGAVRHGGFIPWDDDADILMPRADYERFLQLAKDGLPEGYALDCMDTNPHHWTVLSQVEMSRKVEFSRDRHKGIALHTGPFVDVFPLDHVPADVKKRHRTFRILRRTMWIKSGLHTREKYKTLRRRIKYYYPLKIYGMFRRSLRSLYDQIQGIMTATNDPSLGYLCVFGSLYPVEREVFKKEYFGKPGYMEFEGHMLPVPCEALKVIKQIYGDYMQYPPLKKRKGRHFFDAYPEPIKKAAPEGPNEESPDKIEKKKGNILNKIKKKLLKFPKRVLRALRRGWIGQYYKLPIQEKTVLYDSFTGLGILDSPRALFKRLLEREDFRDFTHVWTIADPKIARPNLEEYKGLDNVIFVKRNSRKHLRYLTTAKYLISDSSIPHYFARRPEQVYLNTWHGPLIKVAGYERPGRRVDATKNVTRNFLNATHMISEDQLTGERMFKQAYLLDGIYEGKILDEPLPRTDAICNTDRGYVLEKLKKQGFNTDKKIILYAPTWRGTLYNSLVYDLSELKEAVRSLREKIDTDEYEVFLRVHYFLYRTIAIDEEMKKICIPFTIDTNELLSVVDILISDYSTIFFDFLRTRRPILFYIPDIEYYTESRGLAIPMEKMPGPVCTTLEEVADKIRHIGRTREECADKYDAMYEFYCSKEDGKVTDRIIDAVFLNKESPVISCKSDKKKLLFMAEFSQSFVSQTSLIKLFEKIDHSKYDVTLLTGDPKKKYQKQILEAIDPHVRILINDKAVNCSWFAKKAAYKALKKGEIGLDEAFRRLGCDYEWRRLVGDSVFDRLCVLQPTSSVRNWMLLSYIAPVDDKVFIQSETAFRSAFLPKDQLGHFGAVYDELEPYAKTL